MALANPDTERDTFDDHVRISIDGDTLTVADAHTGQPDEKDWQVSMVVHVPAHVAVNLRTDARKIPVEGMTSDIKTKSGPGTIGISPITVGNVTASTGAGEIAINVAAVTGPVTANAAAGALSLSITKTPPPKDIVLTAALGDIVLTIPPDSPGTFRTALVSSAIV